MCLDLVYRNSRSEYLVDFSYLAIKDKMLINKVFEDENEINGVNYGGIFDTYLWLKLEDLEGETILTALINYNDCGDVPYSEQTFKSSLQSELTALWNEELWSDLYSNVLDMFVDCVHLSGFWGTYIGSLIDEAVSSPGKYYCQVTDFGMHLPSEDYIHPEFDN